MHFEKSMKLSLLTFLLLIIPHETYLTCCPGNASSYNAIKLVMILMNVTTSRGLNVANSIY